MMVVCGIYCMLIRNLRVDDSTDHKVYYEITGMARRMTEGGYDYYNPCGWNRLDVYFGKYSIHVRSYHES